MNPGTGGDEQGSSTRPYLIRALHDWCTDNGFTPYVAVYVDASVQVPREYVKNQEIVLNIGFEATSGLQLGNEFIEFRARFGGRPRDILVPVDHVVAIYARENGQGMAFPPPAATAAQADDPPAGAPALRLATSEDVTQTGDEPAATGSPADQAGLPADASPDTPSAAPAGEPPADPPPAPGPGGKRPRLKRVK